MPSDTRKQTIFRMNSLMSEDLDPAGLIRFESNSFYGKFVNDEDKASDASEDGETLTESAPRERTYANM